MQPLAAGAELRAYHDRLQSSHDFAVHVDILDMNERMIGSADLLDGQVNITSGSLVRRTASLTLSDPAGALDFSDGSAWSGTHLWVDRLVRVRHQVTVPGYSTITAVPFIGPPTSLSRQGAQVQVECQDKGALAMRGGRPHVVAKGMFATTAIRSIMTYCTGEFRYRIPAYSRRLSRSYSVGLADEAAPLVVAAQIARAELGMQLLYSCDGFLVLRPTPTRTVVDLGYVTEQASSSADFTTVVNYVRVTGGVLSRKVGTATVSTRPISSQTLPASNPVSPDRLQRQGVARLLPLLVSEDGYTTTAQTAARATSELRSKGGITDDISASVVPMFHLDADDLVTVRTDDDHTRQMRLSEASIPLGVGGDMSIGFHRWVSSKALGRPRSVLLRSVARTKKVVTKKTPKRHHKKGRH